VDVIQYLQKNFPLDVGVLAPIFLNVLRLAPGQALFVQPHVLHAYLDGDAVEIMNCSDNVIRAGLTPKLRDAELLCRLLFADESGTTTNYGQKVSEYTKVYRPAQRVRDFELSFTELPAKQKTTLDAFPVASLLLCTSGSGSVSAPTNSLSIKSGQCVLCPPEVSVEISSDEGVTIYRANKNQGTLPDDSILYAIGKILFNILPHLSGDELKEDALEAAALLRPLEQYVSDIWFRAAAYNAIGAALAKSISGNDDITAYIAHRWLQKAVHVCDLAGDDAVDTPVTISYTQGHKVVPSEIKAQANSTLAQILPQITRNN